MMQDISTPEFIAGIVRGDYNENDVIRRCKSEPILMALFKSLYNAAYTMFAQKGVQGSCFWCLSKRRFEFDNTNDLRLYTDMEFVRLQSAMAIVCDHIEMPYTAFTLTEQEQAAFNKAIDVGFMKKTEHGYKWLFGEDRGGKARLAYFLIKVFNPDGMGKIPYLDMEAAFGVTRLDSAVQTQLNTIPKTEKVRQWRAEIDKLFG